MVGFISVPSSDTVEDVVQALKLDDSKGPHPVDICESKSNEISLADSFLDFDSISKWFEELPDPAMTGAEIIGSEADGNRTMAVSVEKGEEIRVEYPIVQVSNSVGEGLSVPVAGEVEPILQGSESVVVSDSGLEFNSGKSDLNGNLNFSIVEGMENVNLAGGSESLVPDGVKAAKSEVDCPADSDDVSSDSESSSSSSSSSGSSSSSKDDEDNNDSNDDDDSEDQVEEKAGAIGRKEKKDENVSVIKRDIDMEVDMEEGEIRDDEGRDNLHMDINGDVDQMVGWSDVDEDDGDGDGKGGPIMSKNELTVLPPVPQVDITLQPHHNMLPVGLVLSILGAQVIVEGVESHNPLNEGSILWLTERRSPLGLVDEIFGPVKNPYYVVRYNCKSEVPTGIQEGTSVSFVQEFASHVLNDKSLHKKGYDASGANDEEISDEAEFSDDEKEAEYKRMRQMTKRGFNDQKDANRNENRKKKNGKGPWNNDRNNSRKAQPAHAPRPHMSSANFDGGSSSSVVGQGLVSRANSFQPRQRQIAEVRPAHAQSQHTIMASVPSSDYTGGSSSSMAGQGLISQPSFSSPFQPISQPTNVTTNPNLNPIWTGGMPIPPPNAMPWLNPNPNPNQKSYEMQILNTVAGITYLQGLLGQHGLNQTTMQMGLPSQPNPLANMVGPGIHSSGLQVQQSQVTRLSGTPEAQPFQQNQMMTPTSGPRNSEPSQPFSFGSSPSRGQNPRGRRGHSRGGGGWQRR